MTTEPVPVADGLFEVTADGVTLIGSRCVGCGVLYFPTALSCRNPACTDQRVEDARFGSSGSLYSWTVQAYGPPPLFRMDDWAPYPLGLVDLPEGLRVLAMLTGCETDDLEIGMALELVVEPLYTDGEGRKVLTFEYAPASTA